MSDMKIVDGRAVIPEGTTEIVARDFAAYPTLVEVYIPASVIEIEEGAFGGCPNLVTIKVDENNPSYDSRGDCNAIIETATNILVQGCKTSVIPDSVSIIGTFAFYDTYLTKIYIPDSVLKIDHTAFGYNAELEEVRFSESLVEIENYAFTKCTALTELEFPKSLTTIGQGAFSHCVNLKSVTLPDSVKEIDEHAFFGVNLTKA